VAISALLLSVGVCAVTLVNYRTAVTVAEETLRNQGVGIGLELAAAAWGKGARGAAELQALLAEQRPREVAFLTVIGRDGTVLAHTNPRLVGTQLDDAAFRRVLGTGQLTGTTVTLGTGEEVYELTVPFHVPPPGGLETANPESPRFRILRIALHTAPARQIVYQAQAQVVLAGVLVVALLGLTGWQLRTLRRYVALREEAARRERLAALGGMAAILAHEIRNPLGGIKGVAQFLTEKSPSDPSQTEMLQAIVVEATRLERLVNDLLTYARPRPPERCPTDLPATIREVMALVGPAADAAGVKVRLDTADPLPPVAADPEQMKQLLGNLVLNALQAMPTSGALTVSTRARPRALGNADGLAWIEIAVEDTGPGIPEDDLPHIFEPFYTTRAKGTGLGLAICRQIAEAHGGSIRVARTGPAGTRIEAALPQEAPHGQ
jgi:two-component system sensor histidine kinase HydH